MILGGITAVKFLFGVWVGLVIGWWLRRGPPPPNAKVAT